MQPRHIEWAAPSAQSSGATCSIEMKRAGQKNKSLCRNGKAQCLNKGYATSARIGGGVVMNDLAYLASGFSELFDKLTEMADLYSDDPARLAELSKARASAESTLEMLQRGLGDASRNQ